MISFYNIRDKSQFILTAVRLNKLNLHFSIILAPKPKFAIILFKNRRFPHPKNKANRSGGQSHHQPPKRFAFYDLLSKNNSLYSENRHGLCLAFLILYCYPETIGDSFDLDLYCVERKCIHDFQIMENTPIFPNQL